MTQLAPGDTLFDTVKCVIKDVTSDAYQSAIKLNTTLTYPEDSISNNVFFGDSIYVDVQELFPNIASQKYLKYGDLIYYKLNAPADNDLAITIKRLTGTGQNVGRVSFEKIPTLSNADIVADDQSLADQTILIPGTQGGYYYILINDKKVSVDSQLIEVKAQFLPLSILSINDNEGGQGQVTTTLTGASFRNNSIVQLKQGNIVVTTGTIVEYKSSMEMDVRWNLDNVNLGSYDVVITNDASTAILPNGFSVEIAEAFQVSSMASQFGIFAQGKTGGLSTTYQNIGNLDIPFMQVSHKSLGHSKSENVISLDAVFDQLFDETQPSSSGNLNKGYVLNLKPGATAKLIGSREFADGGVLAYTSSLKAYSRKQLAGILFDQAEANRQEMMEYLPDHHPELIPVFADRWNYYMIVLEPFLNNNMISLSDIEDLSNAISDRFIDFNPGIQVGTMIESQIELKSTDIFRWEINVPTTALGGAAGQPIGWDFIKSLGDITISAGTSNKFEIAIIPKSPCNNSYTSLTSWEPWHDYKWPIAAAEGDVIGFDPNKFVIDTFYFNKVNNTYGGHFEVSLQADTIFLEFKHKVRLPGEPAYNGGPGLCGFPGGNGEADANGGRGGDGGGTGWGVGSAGGQGGSGASGGGSGGQGYPAGQPGQDTDLDNDQDGIPDNVDLCPNSSNASQTDTDGDGIGDACDPHPNQPDIDSDGDGIIDELDNCPTAANASQKDSDGDGIADACDNKPDWECIPGLDCPKELDCVGPDCDDEPSCSSCGPGSGGSPGGGGSPPAGEDECTQYLKKLDCPRAAIGCFKSILEQIAVQGGTFEGTSTAGTKNRNLLIKAFVNCGIDVLDKCLNIKIPLLGCAQALTGAVKQTLKMTPNMAGVKSMGGPAANFASECLDVNDVKIACGLYNVFAPKDPNEIHGPYGYGDTNTRWIPATSLLHYSISFENDSLLATTAAERVVITQNLPANLNPLSFQLGSVSFQNMSFELPPVASYTGIIDLNDSLNYDVEITAGLDIVNHKVFWVLQTIDPLTGLPPNVLNGGFLPVNDSLGNGQGAVSYTIWPNSNVQTLDTVSVQAEIVFDLNPPIATNIWKNTFDAGLPNSQIDSLPLLILQDSLPMHITSSDDINGSGIHYVRLYYQVNNGPFEYYGFFESDDSLVFTGIEGYTYGFYTIAYDTAGNKEADKTVAQWTVQFGFPDSIEITSPVTYTTFCEQSVIPIQWTSYHVENLQLRVTNTNGILLFTTPYFSDSIGEYLWTLPIVPEDTLILKLVDELTDATFDSDTILINHLKVWFKDADNDGYFVDTPIVSCISPGIDYVNNVVSGGDCNDTSASIHPNSPEVCCNGVDDNCNGLTDESNLYLTLLLQGYYAGGGNLTPCLMNQGIGFGNSICDTIEVQLINPNTFTMVASTKTIINTDGTAICGFQNVGGLYYIVIKHRNTLPTWSSEPIAIAISGENTFYDFTNAANKVFGDNQYEIEPGIWAFYTGDVNQDENIDLLDLSLQEADINEFLFGYYATDINGDGNIDLLDLPILETNITNFIFSIHP